MIAEHFEVIRIQNYREHQKKVGRFSAALGFVGMLLVNYVIPESFINMQMIIGFSSLVFLLGGFKLITDNS